MKILKISLYGIPGAGKSTVRAFIQNYCKDQQIPICCIKLAEPIYEAQDLIYRIARISLSDFYSQDGELLQFLGQYLRKLNPNILLDRFSEQLKKEIKHLEILNPSHAIIICDDMRKNDSSFLRDNGFIFVRVFADETTCITRRKERGDISLGSINHSTERGIDDIDADITIENSSSLDKLYDYVETFISSLLV